MHEGNDTGFRDSHVIEKYLLENYSSDYYKGMYHKLLLQAIIHMATVYTKDPNVIASLFQREHHDDGNDSLTYKFRESNIPISRHEYIFKRLTTKVIDFTTNNKAENSRMENAGIKLIHGDEYQDSGYDFNYKDKLTLKRRMNTLSLSSEDNPAKYFCSAYKLGPEQGNEQIESYLDIYIKRIPAKILNFYSIVYGAGDGKEILKITNKKNFNFVYIQLNTEIPTSSEKLARTESIIIEIIFTNNEGTDSKEIVEKIIELYDYVLKSKNNLFEDILKFTPYPISQTTTQIQELMIYPDISKDSFDINVRKLIGTLVDDLSKEAKDNQFRIMRYVPQFRALFYRIPDNQRNKIYKNYQKNSEIIKGVVEKLLGREKFWEYLLYHYKIFNDSELLSEEQKMETEDQILKYSIKNKIESILKEPVNEGLVKKALLAVFESIPQLIGIGIAGFCIESKYAYIIPNSLSNDVKRLIMNAPAGMDNYNDYYKCMKDLEKLLLKDPEKGEDDFESYGAIISPLIISGQPLGVIFIANKGNDISNYYLSCIKAAKLASISYGAINEQYFISNVLSDTLTKSKNTGSTDGDIYNYISKSIIDNIHLISNALVTLQVTKNGSTYSREIVFESGHYNISEENPAIDPSIYEVISKIGDKYKFDNYLTPIIIGKMNEKREHNKEFDSLYKFVHDYELKESINSIMIIPIYSLYNDSPEGRSKVFLVSYYECGVSILRSYKTDLWKPFAYINTLNIYAHKIHSINTINNYNNLVNRCFSNFRIKTTPILDLEYEENRNDFEQTICEIQKANPKRENEYKSIIDLETNKTLIKKKQIMYIEKNNKYVVKYDFMNLIVTSLIVQSLLVEDEEIGGKLDKYDVEISVDNNEQNILLPFFNLLTQHAETIKNIDVPEDIIKAENDFFEKRVKTSEAAKNLKPFYSYKMCKKKFSEETLKYIIYMINFVKYDLIDEGEDNDS